MKEKQEFYSSIYSKGCRLYILYQLISFYFKKPILWLRYNSVIFCKLYFQLSFQSTSERYKEVFVSVRLRRVPVFQVYNKVCCLDDIFLASLGSDGSVHTQGNQIVDTMVISSVFSSLLKSKVGSIQEKDIKAEFEYLLLLIQLFCFLEVSLEHNVKICFMNLKMF